MTDAVGPCFTGGFEEFVVNGESGEQYTILYLPDRNNDQLQREGKAPVYYWVPGQIRLARFGDNGDFKFRHIHFVGTFDEQTQVGVEGRTEVVGGLLSFTTTSRYPTEVLKKAEEQLLNKFRGNNDRYWGWRTPAAPMFRIAPIRDNRTAITNLAPSRNGTAPAENIGAAAGGTAPSSSSESEPRSLVRRADLSKRVIHGRTSSTFNLDAWAFEIQGQGPGSVTGGENAFAGLVGALPSELIWAGFHGVASPIVVTQNLTLPVWSQEIWLKITGNWDRIFEHFSANVNARYLWFATDIKAEFNNLYVNGDIKVEMAVDGTIPGAEDMEKEINKRIDLITQKFMDEATKRIFEPAPPTVEPAQAPSGGIFSSIFGGGSGGFALKYRRDETQLNLKYEETRYHRYLQPTTISSSFEGIYNEMKRDPEAEKKYFVRLVMGDLSGKITRIVKPVVNWPDPSKNWIGEPVVFLSVDIGYPGPTGSKQWLAHVFQSTDTSAETNWSPVFALRKEDEVSNPPANWKSDVTYLHRCIHLAEPTGMTDNPFVKIDIEKNVIDLDPEEGTPWTHPVVEVRADSAGKLEINPDIDVVLQDNTQIVTVEFRPSGRKYDGSERSIVTFQWRSEDQDKPRYWEIFTGNPDYTPIYDYRVTVNVKGTLFSRGMTWTGPWIPGKGNGSIMVHVPTADEAGVTTRRMEPRQVAFGSLIGQPLEESELSPTSSPSGATSSVTAPPGGSRTERISENSQGHIVYGYSVTKEVPIGESEDIMAKKEVNTKKTTAKRTERLEELTGAKSWVQL